jgi:UDP-N-acetylglucosamine 2-epimerase (non-hydrolysing)
LLPELARAGIDVDVVFTGSRSAARDTGGGGDVGFYGVSLPEPSWSLDIGIGSDAVATGRAMVEFEALFDSQRPDAVLVIGDANASLAAAISAAKAGLPVVHLDAGLRCGNLQTPEEVNRVLISRVAAMHLTPTESALENLEDEAIEPERIHFVGSTMAQSVLSHLSRIAGFSACSEYGLVHAGYVLASFHRVENLNDPISLHGIIGGLSRSPLPVLLPDPESLGAVLLGHGITTPDNVRLIEAVPYRTMLALERDAAVIVTDSSGVQVEACMVHVPCLTVRDCTEWLSTLNSGANRLVRPDSAAIRSAIVSAISMPTTWAEPKRWDRAVSDRIARVLKRGVAPLV